MRLSVYKFMLRSIGGDALLGLLSIKIGSRIVIETISDAAAVFLTRRDGIDIACVGLWSQTILLAGLKLVDVVYNLFGAAEHEIELRVDHATILVGVCIGVIGKFLGRVIFDLVCIDTVISFDDHDFAGFAACDHADNLGGVDAGTG